MNRIFSQSITISISVITLLFMFVSENIFRGYIIIPIFSEEINIITALYNFYAASVVTETSLHKA